MKARIRCELYRGMVILAMLLMLVAIALGLWLVSQAQWIDGFIMLIFAWPIFGIARHLKLQFDYWSRHE